MLERGISYYKKRLFPIVQGKLSLENFTKFFVFNACYPIAVEALLSVYDLEQIAIKDARADVLETMMKASVYPQKGLPYEVSAQIFEARAHQFVDRLGWDLLLDAKGTERDQFDDEHAHYVTVEDDVRHLLSCRLRPATSGTMVEQCFSDVFPHVQSFLSCQRQNLWELTRFCKSRDVSVRTSAQALFVMSYELDRIRDREGLSGFVAVVYPYFARFLRCIGTRYIRLGEGWVNGQRTYLICVTHAVDHRNIQTSKSELNQLPRSIAA